jgi:hypothetical protein
MTYGWMLLVVAIAGGAVFSFVQQQGIQSSSGFSGDNFQVADFGMTTTGLGFILDNLGPEEVTITQINISQENSTAVIPFNKEVEVGESTGMKLPHFIDSGATNTVNVNIKHNIGKLFNITLQGELKGGFEIDESIVGYWTLRPGQVMDDKMYDISQNSAHGDLVNVNFEQDDKFGEVMSFDGSSKISLTGDRGSTQTDDITVMAWAKTNKSNWFMGEGALFRIKANAGEDAEFWIREQGFGSSNTIRGGEIQQDKWHHYTGVYNSETGNQKLYVDGELVATEKPDFESIGDYHKNLCVGESYCGSGSYFEGKATEVIIFNRALDQAQVKSFSESPGFELE